jgi:hypothetical protein
MNTRCTMRVLPHRGPARGIFMMRCTAPATRLHPVTTLPICARHFRALKTVQLALGARP